MSSIDVLPELKELIGALLFGARKPLTADDIRKVLRQVGEEQGGPAADFAAFKKKDIVAAVDELKRELETVPLGIRLVEVANGYRLENLASCGPWLRRMLDKAKPNKLSRPSLETLAIIAYRQPCTRAEIESVRGVAVDQIVRNLLEMQLIRVTGRSELPGRPWLFGTSQRFLEQFGLKGLDDLPGVEELRKLGDLKGKPASEAEDGDEEQLELAVDDEKSSATGHVQDDLDEDQQMTKEFLNAEENVPDKRIDLAEEDQEEPAP